MLSRDTFVRLFFTILLSAVLVGCKTYVPKSYKTNDRSPRVVRIYSEITYKLLKKRAWGRDLKTSHAEMYNGSGFLWQGKIVSARHVLFGPDPQKIKKLGEFSIDEEEYAIVSRSLRLHLSEMNYSPETLWVSQDVDVAVLQMSKKELNRLNLHQAACSRSANIGEPVVVWGFPGTSSPHVTSDLRVVAVNSPDYLVLSGPLGGGFSGGPVLGNDGCLLGVASRTEEKQSRVMLLPENAFREKPVEYNDGLLLHPSKQRIAEKPVESDE